MTHVTKPDTLTNEIIELKRRLTDIERVNLQGNAPLVSKLPPIPEDGQEIRFQNAAMEAQGVEWRLVYRAASASAHKWEFVGGNDLQAYKAGPNRITLASKEFVFQVATGSPTLTVPLTGDYYISFGPEYLQLAIAKGAAMQLNMLAGTASLTAYTTTQVYVTPALSAGTDQFITSSQFTRSLGANIPASTGLVILCGGNDLTVELWQTGGYTISILPVRVG